MSQDRENDDKIGFFHGARAAAVRILSRFERSDSYLDKLVDYELRTGNLNDPDKSLLTEIVNGVIRWKAKLDWILTGFYQGDYLKCLNIVKNSMRVALYQILFLDRIPIHAAINESVEIVKRIQGEKTAGIVNGVLRNIARNIENIRFPDKDEDIVYFLSVMYSHPRWMVKHWLDRYGEYGTEKMLYMNNRRPYIAIRVNTLKATVEEVIEFLNNNNIPYFQSQYLGQSIIIKSPKMDISSLEIFKKGYITIQDTAQSLAAMLAAAKPGQNVVDLCSAPGGKAFAVAEQMKDNGKIIAIDKYKQKLNLIENGAERLGIKSISTMLEDAREIHFDTPADIVLADVPCTGLGTISKKPDIKWKREREDIYKMVEVQREILENAATLIGPGGVIVYSTCTIEPEENEENIRWFLENHPEFEIDPAEKYLPKEVCSDGFMQTIPYIHSIDGAFAARLVKKINT